MSHVDLAFNVTAQQPVPADHGYALYAAVSRVLPNVHHENGIAIHPLRGRQIGSRQLMPMPWTRHAFGETMKWLAIHVRSRRLFPARKRSIF